MHAVLSIPAIKCYHCDIPLMDYHDCYKIKTCAKGEVSATCILSEFGNFREGFIFAKLRSICEVS